MLLRPRPNRRSFDKSTILCVEPLEDRRVLATFFVSSLANDGPDTLRQALLDANANSGLDIIRFRSGTSGSIDLQSELVITDGVEIIGPSDELIIDAQQNSRVFYETADDPVTISNLTITGGSATVGGGAYIKNGFMTFNSVQITGNVASESGGGVFAGVGYEIALNDSIVTGNQALGGSGGGLRAELYVEVESSYFYDNTALNGFGGAISLDRWLEVESSQFVRNRAGLGGGAVSRRSIAFDDSLTNPFMSFEDTEFRLNSTTGQDAPGGAVSMRRNGFMRITNTSFTDNFTRGRNSPGGAIWKDEDGFIGSTGATFVGNHTLGEDSHGGALAIESFVNTRVTFDDATFGNNRTRGRNSPGGAIYLGIRGEMALTNSVLDQNFTSGDFSHGGAIGIDNLTDVELADTTVSRNYTMGFQSSGGGIGLDPEDSFSTVGVERSVIRANRTEGNQSHGGGVASTTLNLQESKISGNSTLGANSPGGGARAAQGDIRSSAIVFNETEGTGGEGGGLFLSDGTNLREFKLFNSTISRNTATVAGGGIFVEATGSMVGNMRYATITRNEAPAGAGFAYQRNTSRQFTITSSIISGNRGPDVELIGAPGSFPRLRSGGYNIVGTSNVPQRFGVFDQKGVTDPMLGPLTNHGGLTPSHVPRIDSPAIDAAFATPPAMLPTDQRGESFPRVVGLRSDVGAIEVQFSVTDTEYGPPAREQALAIDLTMAEKRTMELEKNDEVHSSITGTSVLFETEPDVGYGDRDGPAALIADSRDRNQSLAADPIRIDVAFATYESATKRSADESEEDGKEWFRFLDHDR